jgi:hypothetical protein
MSYNSKQLKVQSSAKKLPKPKDVDYISKMGYRDDSPFRDNPYNDIYTPNGIIDMSQTGIPLFANGQYLPPYSGMHDMGTENVREIPVAKKGGQKGLRQFTSKNIQTSLNDIMQRNTTLFGSSGKKRYKPDLNYKYGGWLDQYQGGDQVNTSNWKKSSKDSFNLYNRGEEMVKWAKENPNFTTIEHNKKDDELNIKYPVSSMPWSGKNSFIGATNWATLNSTKSGYWGVPLYDKPVGVQKEIKQQLVVSPPVVSPFVIPAPVAVPKVQTEYVIRENNFGPPIKYRINPNTKQYYPITDIPKNTPQSDITIIPFVNEMKKYGGWLEQYQGDQNGSETGTGKEVTSETNNFKSERDFLIAMANSSLFTDRYKNMTGGINNEETESFRKNVINNINNAKINVGITSTGKPWTDEGSLGAYVNQFPEAKDYIKNGVIPDNYDKFLYTNKGFPHHNIFTKNESPTVITHELSHASTFGDNLLSQFSPKLSKLKENESFVKKYSEPDYNRATEHKAYLDEIRKYLYENKIYDAIKNNFTEDDYNKVIKERSKLNNKSDVKSAFDAILDPYDKDEVIKMFNSYTSSGKNNKQLPIAKYGGWLDTYQDKGPVSTNKIGSILGDDGRPMINVQPEVVIEGENSWLDKLNPKNWGVKDYTKEFETQGQAFNAARKAGEKEFMWNNERFNTNIKGEDKQENNTNFLNKAIADNITAYGFWSGGNDNVAPNKELAAINDKYRRLQNEANKKYNYVPRTSKEQSRVNLPDELKKIYIKNKEDYNKEVSKIAYNVKTGEKIKLPKYTHPDTYKKRLENYEDSDFSNINFPILRPANINASQDALSIHQGQPQKYNSFELSKYKPTITKNDNVKNYEFKGDAKQELEDDLFKYKNSDFINSKEKFRQVKGSHVAQASLKDFQYSKGNDDRGKYVAYSDKNDYGNILDIIPNSKPFDIYGRIYYKDYGKGNVKMYYSDKELSALDSNKKDFDTQGLQRELNNRGYQFPRSTTSDNTFDGIYGDETKNALLDWQNKNNKKQYGGNSNNWLDQYQDGSQTKANPLLIQAFQQSLANQKINEQKVIDAKNQEIKNNPLGIKTLTTARDNTNVVPVRQLTTLSNIEADKKRNEADRLLKQQKKTQGTLRETPKEINPNEAWRLAASNYQGHDKEEMNRIINSSKTVEGLGALAGVTGGGLHALVSIPAVANTIGLGFAVNGVHSLPSTYRTLVDPNESVYNKARALTYNTADFLGMKQAAEALKGIGTAGKWAYNNAARSVATSKQSGLLSNAHNLNPKAFKPNPEDYYRGIGEKGLKNAQETNSIISRDPKYYTSPYFSQQGDFRMAQAFNDDVIVEAKGKSLYDDLANLNKNDLVFTRSNMGNVPLKHNSLSNVTPGVNLEGNLVDVGLESIPLNNPNIRILKKDWWQGYKPIEVPKQLPGSPNVTSSVNDVFPITLTTPNSGYKFPKVSPDAKSIAIHESNKFVDANWKARNNIETFFKNNNIDVATLPQSKMVSSKVGYDYVLPEGVTHDMLNEYARLHHSKFPISEEFKQVGETIRKLNPDAKINPISSHSIHGVASNIHPDFNGKLGQGLEVPKQLPGSPNVDPPIQQMGFFNTKGAFQKYPKGKLTQEEINAFKNSDHYKQSTKEHLELKNKFGNSWTLPNYAEEALQEAITTGNRSRINPILYGGRNWGVNDYIIAGLAGTAYPGVAGLYGLAFSPPAVKNKVLNTAGITSTPGTLSSKDTTINITNRPMDFAKVNETADGQVIIGGEFIEGTNNTVRKAKDWLTATDTYSDKEYPSKDIQSFYGIEDGKFKVGKASEFKPNTEIVPRRFGATNISQAILNEGAMRLLDNDGNPIYQNTPNTGKFILYSPSTKEVEFNYINTGKSGVDKVNKFLKKNKDAQYIHLDNGRYEFYGLNPEGLSGQDFRDYYQQDLEREGNPGYNMIIKKHGGWLDEYQDGGGPIKYETILGDDGKPMLNIQPEVEIIDNKYKSPLLIGTKGSFINSNGSDNVWDKVKQQWVAPPKYPGLQPQLTESKSKIPTRVEEIPSKRIIAPLTEIHKPIAESTGVPVNNAATINKKLDAAEMSKLAPFIAAEKRNQEATAVARYRNEQARANGTATGLYDEANEVRKYLYQQDKKKADEDRTAVMMAGLALAPAALYIAGVPAVSTALAAGFGAHGVYSIPNTYRNWVAAANPNNETTWQDSLGTTALNALDFWGTGQVLKQGSRLYNTVATGQSALPIAWKSQAVGLSQEASQKMFNSLVNSGKLTDAERALIVEYQHHSRAFTGRGVPVNLEKQQALNNIINKYNLSVGENTLLTRRFNPDNNSLGATLENGRLNFGNRPTSFSAGIGIDGYNSGAVNRLVIPSKYVQKMSGNFLANEYGNLSDDALNLMSNETKEFSKWIGDKKSIINAEKEVIGTGLDFKRIGKVKNDIGGHDWIVRPSKQVPKQLPGSPNAVASSDNVGKGIKQTSNKIDQTIIDDYTKQEINWLNSEEYIKRNMAATGKTRKAVIKETDKIIKQVNKTTLNTFDDKADMAAGVYVQDKNKPIINLFNTGNEKQLLNTADHEIKHAVSQQAIRSNDGLIDLVTNPYKKYPTVNVKKWYDNFIPGETTSKWASNAPEQQVVSKRIMDLVEKTQGVKRGTQLTDDNIKSVIDLLNKEIKNGNPQNSDIIAMLSSFKSKFGKNYYPIVKDMVNKAYVVPAAIIGEAALQQKKYGGAIKKVLKKDVNHNEKSKFVNSQNSNWLNKYQ